MRKLTFDFISIEVTRRCNLNCRHCLRGDAQDVDIDFSTIDVLAEQAEKIYRLELTGGEPTLNVPAIQHTLNALRVWRVPLHYVEVATNGVVLSKEFAETIKDFAGYIDSWKKDFVGYMAPGNNAVDTVNVGVSKDRYHKGADPDAAFEFYRRELAGVAGVKFMQQGNMPMRIGRGRALAGAKQPPVIGCLPHKIETWEEGKPCSCKVRDIQWPAPRGSEKLVCCKLKLSARGDLALYKTYGQEYDVEDKRRDLVICNLSPDAAPAGRDIDCGIAAYNRWFDPCHEVQAREWLIQMEEYDAAPEKIVQDLRWARESAQADPTAREMLDALIEQMPEAAAYLS